MLSDGAATHTIAVDESWLMPGTSKPSDVKELSSCEVGGGIQATVQGITPYLVKAVTATGPRVPRFLFRQTQICPNARGPVYSEPQEKAQHGTYIDESMSTQRVRRL